MIWTIYEKKFKHLAYLNDFDDVYIAKHLSYAKKLFDRNLPVIFDGIHLSLLLGIKIEYITKVSNSQRKFYREFEIPKKSGSTRTISEPLPNLKYIQKWILDEILYNLTPSKYSKAYKKKTSIKDNARFHRGQKKVLTIDIQDYFGSIKFKEVITFFSNIGYSNLVSTVLANLCTLNECLPQGAPTSPMLSNLITKAIDERIAAFVLQHNIRYSRYADDLTFSGDFEEGMIINFVTKVLQDYSFEINPNKTRVRYSNQRQEVTGIIVNEKMQAPREQRRKFRQEVYYIRKFGVKSHELKTNNNKSRYLYHLIGKGNHYSFLNPFDMGIKEDVLFLIQLLKEL